MLAKANLKQKCEPCQRASEQNTAQIGNGRSAAGLQNTGLPRGHKVLERIKEVSNGRWPLEIGLWFKLRLTPVKKPYKKINIHTNHRNSSKITHGF